VQAQSGQINLIAQKISRQIAIAKRKRQAGGLVAGRTATMCRLTFGPALLFGFFMMLGSSQAEDKISISQLLKDGWQIAGYTATHDNRSSFILFRHEKRTYLVNCRVGYDVTRKPRSYTNCYELR
jgi:hypothetical protein